MQETLLPEKSIALRWMMMTGMISLLFLTVEIVYVLMTGKGPILSWFDDMLFRRGPFGIGKYIGISAPGEPLNFLEVLLFLPSSLSAFLPLNVLCLLLPGFLMTQKKWWLQALGTSLLAVGTTLSGVYAGFGLVPLLFIISLFPVILELKALVWVLSFVYAILAFIAPFILYIEPVITLIRGWIRK